MAGRHNPREKGRSASAQDGAGMCTTPMPQPLTQPSCALPKNAICPTKLTTCDEGRMTRCGNTWRGDMTHKRNGRSASAQDGAGMCTTPMPHFLTQPLLALPKHAICPTKLTCCDEGSMTQEGNTWRADITQERKDGQQVHKMGQVCAPHACHNPSHNPRMHCRKNAHLHNQTHSLRRRNHNTGGKRVVGDITQERKEGQQVHKMGQVCAPHPCHSPSRNPPMRHRQKHLPHPTHQLQQRKHDTGGKRVVGDITQKRKDD